MAESNTKFCFECGEEIDSDISFCPECGAKHDQSNNSSEDTVSSQTQNSEPESDINVEWLAFSFPPKLAYHLTWGGMAFIFLGAFLQVFAGWPSGTSYLGLLISGIGIWVDMKYVTQINEQWQPNKKLYLAGTFLLMILAVPLYLYRRSKYI